MIRWPRLGVPTLLRLIRGHDWMRIAVSDTTPECRDGIGNDGDAFTDFPDDPECSSESDTCEDI